MQKKMWLSALVCALILSFASVGLAASKSVVTPPKAPKAVGPYSQGIVTGNLVFTSGQLPIEPLTNEMPKGIEAQAKQALENVKAVLEAAGSSMDKVVKITIFLKDLEDFKVVNEIYGKYFTKDFPARSCVQVARIPKDALVEVEATAIK